jgi:hypothetical protein
LELRLLVEVDLFLLFPFLVFTLYIVRAFVTYIFIAVLLAFLLTILT